MRFIVGVLICLASCAHSGPRQMIPLCDTPQLVLLGDSEPLHYDEIVQSVVDQWNYAAGREILIYAGRIDLSSGTLGEAPMIVISSLHQSEADSPFYAALARQYQRNGCSRGTKIEIYRTDEDVHPRTIEYLIKHEIGHAIGQDHSAYGVMSEHKSSRLWDYYRTGGKIDIDTAEAVRKDYEVLP